MEPRDPGDELLVDEAQRWERISEAKTPEELARSLRGPSLDQPPSGGRRVGRALAGLLFPAIVVVALAAIALENREPEPEPPPESVERRIDPTFAGYGITKISPASVGPFLSTPRVPVVAVVPARGGTPHGATPRDVAARSVDWRPDGRALLVAVTDGLVEVPVGGAGNALWRRHRRVAALRGESPAYTPDGRRITFLAVLADLVVVDRAGRGVRLLVDRVGWREPLGFDWSQQGRLAVVAGGELFVGDDGSTLDVVDTALPGVAWPSWAPDGRRIAYTQLNPRRGDGLMRVEVVRLGSRRLGERVGSSGSTSAYPAWSPDGRSIAYARFFEGTWDLFVTDLETGRQRRLTSGIGDEVEPAWSPDSRWIAFVASEIDSGR